MKAQNTKNTYNADTRKKYIKDDIPLLIATSNVETKYKWVNQKRTDEIEGYAYHFAQDGVNPFVVKVAEKSDTLPDYLTPVELENFEAIEYKGRVYFRASRIKVVK